MNKKRIKIVDKLINVVLDIAIFIFGVILLITLYNNIQVKILKNTYSSFFGYSIFGVQTGSMADAINAGDWIIVRNSNEIKVNDVVTYYRDGDFITHRVVEAYNGTYITKGDANNAKDEPISRDQIVGKVVKILPNFTVIQKVLFNPIVLMALIITLYLIGFLFKRKNNISDEKTENNVSKKILEFMDVILEKVKNSAKLKKEKLLEIKKENKIKEDKVFVEEKKEEIKPEIIKEEEVTQVINEENVVEQDEEALDKTMCFRMISVDEDDIDDAYVDKSKVESFEVDEKSIKKEIEEVEKEEVIKKNLEILQKKKKKCKNVIDRIMFVKEEQIKKIVDDLLVGEKLKSNELTIKDKFVKGYIDGKYYNYCGEVNVEYNSRNMIGKLEKAMEDLANSLVKSYKGTDKQFKEKVLKYEMIFKLMIRLEHDNEMLDSIKSKRETYANNISKFIKFKEYEVKELKLVINNIIKDQKLYDGMIKYTLNKLETNMFTLEMNEVSKNVYAISLEHNIAFSKIYSDYIVDKTYKEGIVAEDKIEVLLALLLSKLVGNMLNADFKNKYLISIPSSMYDKDNKLDAIFDKFDDEYARNNIIVVINYDTLSSHKGTIKKLIKSGYRFAVDLNNSTKFKVGDQSMLELMDYLFLSNKNPNKDSIMLFVPKELHVRMINEDIMSKLEI